MKNIIFKICFICLLLAQATFAQSDYAEVLQALSQQEEERALSLCEQLKAREELSFGLFYNEGLAYRNLKKMPRARASFEKALAYSPRSLQARRRLSEVIQQLDPQIPENDVRGTPWWTATEAIVILSLFALSLFALGVMRLFAYRFRRLYLGLSFSGFIIFTGLVLLSNPAEQRAIVISPSARLLAQPESASEGSSLPTGLRVAVLQRKSHFLQIQLGDRRIGWLRRAEIELIPFPSE